MTRRYIGEYRSKTDLLYRQTISLDNGLLDVEIVDVSAETDNEFPIEQIQWADSCLIVYSITDRESFKYATSALGNLKSLQNGPSAYLIGNKADLDHLREVRSHIEFYFILAGWTCVLKAFFPVDKITTIALHACLFVCECLVIVETRKLQCLCVCVFILVQPLHMLIENIWMCNIWHFCLLSIAYCKFSTRMDFSHFFMNSLMKFEMSECEMSAK